MPSFGNTVRLSTIYIGERSCSTDWWPCTCVTAWVDLGSVYYIVWCLLHVDGLSVAGEKLQYILYTSAHITASEPIEELARHMNMFHLGVTREYVVKYGNNSGSAKPAGTVLLERRPVHARPLIRRHLPRRWERNAKTPVYCYFGGHQMTAGGQN